MDYLARPNDDRTAYQTLREHQDRVAFLCAQNCKSFTDQAIGEMLGLLHDAGKYTDAFQKRVRGAAVKTQHAIAGACECERLLTETRNPLYRHLAYCIAGHHVGLPDWSSSHGSKSELKYKLNHMDELIGDYSAYRDEIQLPPLPACPPFPKERASFSQQMFIRFLFSALVDADRTDAQDFTEHAVIESAKQHLTLVQMEDIFTKETAAFQQHAKDTPLNRIRRGILDSCLSAAQGERGIYTLSVPTGGGKTRSSLAFALRHAVKHGMERIIYSIPFTSIIEQNAGVYEDIFGMENVLEHHCHFEPPKKTREQEDPLSDKRLSLVRENYDMPLIVTTNVQFFESMFSNRPSRVRKLHRYANSVIILDEAQALPSTYLRPCLLALHELCERYGCTVVLCTATQPNFQKNGLLPPDVPVTEIIPDKQTLFQQLKRVDGCFLGKQSGEQMGERLRAHDQALCVVNTKRQAAELFRQLGEEEDGCFYLSTNLTPQHRKQVIAQIRKRLSDPARPVCRVVSTQLIEAGVDLDFPVVYRSLAGIDSILQAAGRCNREGKLPNATVYVYDPAESYLGSGYLGTTARIARDVIDDFGETDFLSEQAVDAYFAELYDLSGDQVDKYDISRENRQDAVNMQFQFQQIADKFKLIDSQGVPVIIRDDGTQREDGDDHPDSVNRLLEQLPYVKGLGGILQKLSQHSVNVRPQVLERLEMLGAISRPLMDSSGNSTDGVYVLERPEYYHHLTGLTVPDEENELDYIV